MAGQTAKTAGDRPPIPLLVRKPENPLSQAARDPSKFLVAFVAAASALGSANRLLAEPWAPDALAVGGRAAYLWRANGIMESRLMQAFARATADAATTRNWATVLKLQAAASGQNVT